MPADDGRDGSAARGRGGSPAAVSLDLIPARLLRPRVRKVALAALGIGLVAGVLVYLIAPLWAAIVVGVLTIVNYLGIREGKVTQNLGGELAAHGRRGLPPLLRRRLDGHPEWRGHPDFLAGRAAPRRHPRRRPHPLHLS